MAALPPAKPHGHCTSKRCVEWLSLFPQGEDGSANANGKAGEDVILRQLLTAGIPTTGQPRADWSSPDDKGIRPDFFMWVNGPGDDDENSFLAQSPALGEAKVQLSGGSAYQKIEHSLRRYAHLSDENDTPVIVFHMMCPVLVGRGTLDELEVLAEHHGIGWIAFEDISSDRISRVVYEVTAARKRRVARARMDELIAELGIAGIGALARYAVNAELGTRREAAASALAAEADLWTGQDELFDISDEESLAEAVLAAA